MKEWLIIIIPVVLVQYFVPILEVQIGIMIALGLFFAFFSAIDKVFLKTLVAGSIVPLLVNFINASGNEYVDRILEAVGIPAIAGLLIFVVFNALTTAFCFQIGYSLRAITAKKRR